MKLIKNYYREISAFGSIVVALVASVANAQTSTLLTAPTSTIPNAQSLVGLFCGALNWLFWGLIVLSIAMFLVGGYMYATSGGDAEKTSKATRTLTYAAIGIVVALVAQGVPSLITSFLGSSANVSAC